MKATEKIIHQQICDYIKLQYPNVIFLSDASGMRVSMGLRMELKRKRCKGYKIPDIIILAPYNDCGIYFHSLILEVKKSISDVYLKNSTTLKKDTHVMEQQKTISELNRLGYAAYFVFGFEYAKRIIDNYMKNVRSDIKRNNNRSIEQNIIRKAG